MEAVMMLKMIILQTLHSVQELQTEMQLLDRRRFSQFLGPDDGGNSPVEIAIWQLHQALVRVDALVSRFDAHFRSLGYLAKGSGSCCKATARLRSTPLPRRGCRRSRP